MAFSDLVHDLDATVEATFADFDAAPIVVHSQSGGDLLVLVTQSSPQFRDDYVPGSASGVAILMLFIASGTYAALAVKPLKGDTATVGGVDYDVVEVPVDPMGAATMHCRKRGV